MKKRIHAALLSLALGATMALPSAALKVDDARNLLRDYYISELPAAAEQADNLDDLFAALKDPYTLYYTAEEYAEFLDEVNGEKLVGIGVTVQTTFDKGFELLSILPNSPAMKAGLKAGDTVIAVDGVEVNAQDNIAGLLSGEEGSQVTVTVRRASGIHADFTMARAVVQIPIATYEQHENIGYFDCSSFGESTVDAIVPPLAENHEDIAVWVMDLRSNPGGVTDSAAVAASQFVGGGSMVYFRDGQGDLYASRTSPLIRDLTDKPLIVLTSPSTASSSELFSGAIRDNYAGIAIGQRTYGKGIAQILLDESVFPDLFQGDALKVTAYQFFSPAGLTNHLAGVLPTLMLDEADVPAVTALLSAPAPVGAQNRLKVVLAGQDFYLDLKLCREEPRAVTALLEALPPAAGLYVGTGAITWQAISPAQLAKKMNIPYTPRTFSDLEGCEQRTAIDTLACYALVAGDENGNFLPDRQLTRAELSAMLAAALQLPAVENTGLYSDVPADAWYTDAVSAMTARGFMAGTGDGRFEPDRVVTHVELYTVLSAIAVWANMNCHDLAQTHVSAIQWLDVYYYPEWAQSYTRNLIELGVSVDKENPTAPVTRAHAAQTLYELMDAIGMFWY